MRKSSLPFCLFTLALAFAAPPQDAVPTLPDYGVPPSPMWSGYLDAGAAEPGTKLHYWFAAAEREDWNSPSVPVVLWLNGGPGLMHNPYAWTKQANLLIMEAPAGVGYSFCKAMLTNGSCSNTDISTAAANRAAVQDFFKTKFPELRESGFFITGESYAGVYVPTLSKELLDNAPEVNIKGMAVGDPCTDRESQTQSMDMLWYAHKNGFVPDPDYDFLTKNCSYAAPAFIARGTWKREQGQWNVAEARRSQAEVQPLLSEAQTLECTVAYRRFVQTTSKGLSQSWDGSYINELDLFTDAAAYNWAIPDTENYYNAQYMSRADVRRALHVEEAPVQSWPGPADGWSYTSSWDACNSAPGKDSMVQFYRNIAPRLERTIVFNGDTDPCVSYEGTRTAIEKVGFQVLPGGHYRPWFYNKTKAPLSTMQAKPNLFGPNLELQDAGAQYGGHVVNYEHHLSFATVHGSGHMVPQFRPQAAERLLSQLLHGDVDYPFSPKMATDEELAKMSDDEFDANVDSWTNLAKADV